MPASLDIPQLLFVYLHGDAVSLTTQQRRSANDMLLGRAETYPTSFAWARSLALTHPAAQELQAAFLRMALYFALQPDRLGRSRSIALRDCQQTLFPWLHQMPQQDALLQTECLIIGAFLVCEAPEWSSSPLWQEAVPTNWARVQAALPIFQSLQGMPMNNENALHMAFSLTQMLGPELPKGLSAMVLPQDLLGTP